LFETSSGSIFKKDFFLKQIPLFFWTAKLETYALVFRRLDCLLCPTEREGGKERDTKEDKEREEEGKR
jgi:hypothetical protein